MYLGNLQKTYLKAAGNIKLFLITLVLYPNKEILYN